MRQWIDRDAANAGLSAERLARIGPALQRYVQPARVAGVQTLLWRGGRIVHELSLGDLDRERGVPMPDHALFRIFSMTKPLTCVLLMMLWEEGRVRLDDPVAAYLPAFAGVSVLETDADGHERLVAPRRPMTVHDLLTHQSGLSYHFHEYGRVEAMYREADFGSAALTLREFAERLAALPLAFHPGARFRYGFSHDVLAALIEVAAQRPFEDLLAHAILGPLGMSDTKFNLLDDERERLAALYGAGSVSSRELRQSEIVQAAMRGDFRRLSAPLDAPPPGAPAAARGGHGLFSTTHDYLRFCRMLIGGGAVDGVRLLGRKTVELMTSNHLPAAGLPFEIGGERKPGYGYGLGMRVMLDPAAAKIAGSVGEFGWSGVASTYFWIDPAEQMIGIQMAQFQPSGLFPVERDFRTLAYAALVD